MSRRWTSQRGHWRVAEAAGTTDHWCDAASLGHAPPERVQLLTVAQSYPGDPDAHERAPVVFAFEDRIETGWRDRDLGDDRRRDRLGSARRLVVTDFDGIHDRADRRRLLIDLLGPSLERDLDPIGCCDDGRRERDRVEQRPADLQAARQ